MEFRPIITPRALLEKLPLSPEGSESIERSRTIIWDIIHGRDARLLVIVGPCSLHDRESALEYARWLVDIRDCYRDSLYIVMRAYFEKPRTTVGWKWLINDPHLDGSHDIAHWVELGRSILLDITALGLPVGTEFLDTLSHQYFSDLVSWGAIWARTTESQIHREMASWLCIPIGFKNATNGTIWVALDAMMAASRSHTYLSTSPEGILSIGETPWNPDTHIILRGGTSGPNYQKDAVMWASALLEKSRYHRSLMVDLSHANSAKNHMNQLIVARDIAAQRSAWESPIMGVMIESHLIAWAQKYAPWVDNRDSLTYGQSITDACIGLEDTREIFEILAETVREDWR